ncbi:siderophore-interacting protein [Microbacterium sp. cx-59]|uniref:siderophore-interacting protein n=1 Tax=Microbacterium sp. cx-59 TaxID=2891207 RepID=UPI001E42AC36|nr:siderophore-interacting protein [Microbacterium sp. cx-59]MCC4908498.1 siderophore-interacting protein [Microbacterium sp. cx-59]
MARSSRLIKPAVQELLHLRVVRTRQVSAHWMRITLGEGDIDRFTPMGFDQWFRIFLPVGGEAGLDRVPAKANKLIGYLKFLRIPEGMRPVMRNYTVRAYRPASADGGAELDVDFVLHGTGPDAGPASRWAHAAVPGDSVVIIDEGITFHPDFGLDRVLLVADETGLPAVAGICANLPADAVGTALVEVPSAEDALEFDRPAGVDVRWLVRDAETVPGTLALAEVRTVPLAQPDVHAFVVGEQALATGGRRALVERGVPKDAIGFVGYWRVGPEGAAPHPHTVASGEETR